MASQATVDRENSSRPFTRTDCERCGGLMVWEHCEDLRDDTGQICFDARRCVQCGNVLDAVIERNRLHPEAAISSRRNKLAGAPSALIFNHRRGHVSGQSAAQSNQGAS